MLFRLLEYLMVIVISGLTFIGFITCIVCYPIMADAVKEYRASRYEVDEDEEDGAR